MGEQDLRRAQVVFGKRDLVSLRQAHLPDGGGGLEFMHRGGAFGPAKAGHALGDGAARDQHDLLALLVQQGDLACPLRDGIEVKAPAVVGDE